MTTSYAHLGLGYPNILNPLFREMLMPKFNFKFGTLNFVNRHLILAELTRLTADVLSQF